MSSGEACAPKWAAISERAPRQRIKLVIPGIYRRAALPAQRLAASQRGARVARIDYAAITWSDYAAITQGQPQAVSARIALK